MFSLLLKSLISWLVNTVHPDGILHCIFHTLSSSAYECRVAEFSSLVSNSVHLSWCRKSIVWGRQTCCLRGTITCRNRVQPDKRKQKFYVREKNNVNENNTICMFWMLELAHAHIDRKFLFAWKLVVVAKSTWPNELCSKRTSNTAN